MAVYKRTYKGYRGVQTSAFRRWTVLSRYSQSRLFQSKWLPLFLAICVFYPVICIAYLYILNNPLVPVMLGIPSSRFTSLLNDGRFYYFFCVVQGLLALLLTAIVGPNLVSPDIANGALQLYFCRPFSRIEYVAGKLGVLLPLLSLITWIPGLIVYFLQGAIVGGDWASNNLYLAGSMLVGFFVWIVLLSLVAMALSSLMKWRLAASATILAVFFAGAGFGTAINNVMRTNYGTLVDLSGVARMIWADLLRYDAGFTLPITDAWVVVGLICLVSCWILFKRIRAFEVVK